MTPQPCVAFVDDEPHLLSGIRRALHSPSAPQWRTAFLDSAEDALALTDSCEVDAVVSDMHLTGTDGVALLSQVRQRHPSIVRIVLSGYADPHAIRIAVSSAHQFLTKPCSVPTVVNAVERALTVRDALGAPELRSLLAGISTLPALPAIYHELVDAMSREDVDTAAVAAILSRDLAMSAEVLRLVNSSFFGLAHHVESVEQAVALLGLDNLQALVLAGSLFVAGDDAGTGDLERVRDRSLRRMTTARRLGTATGDLAAAEVKQVALAALLRDVGLLVLAPWRPEAAARLQDLADADPDGLLDGARTAEAEREAYGCTVAEASACLLGLWAFPDGVVHAVGRELVTAEDTSAALADRVLAFAHQWVLREDLARVGAVDADADAGSWPVAHDVARRWDDVCAGH